jgi:hypothetical protein
MIAPHGHWGAEIANRLRELGLPAERIYPLLGPKSDEIH